MSTRHQSTPKKAGTSLSSQAHAGWNYSAIIGISCRRLSQKNSPFQTLQRDPTSSKHVAVTPLETTLGLWNRFSEEVHPSTGANFINSSPRNRSFQFYHHAFSVFLERLCNKKNRLKSSIQVLFFLMKFEKRMEKIIIAWIMKNIVIILRSYDESWRHGHLAFIMTWAWRHVFRHNHDMFMACWSYSCNPG